MWNILHPEDYLVNLKQSSALFDIFITDLSSLWESHFTIAILISNFKQCNPNFDMPEDKMLKMIAALYTEINTEASHSIERSDEKLRLHSVGKFKTFSYAMNITLSLSEPEQLFLKLVAPMLVAIKSQQEREKKLVNLIKAKDVELEEYKLEGVQIKRSKIITEPFSYEEFNKSHEVIIQQTPPPRNSLFKSVLELQEIILKEVKAPDVKTEIYETGESQDTSPKAESSGQLTEAEPATIVHKKPTKCSFPPSPVKRKFSTKRALRHL